MTEGTRHGRIVKMNNKILTVRILNYWGRITIRPECEDSKLFTELLGQKTLTEENIEIIKRLGYEVRTVEVKL